jgi:hypothetical protein
MYTSDKLSQVEIDAQISKVVFHFYIHEQRLEPCIAFVSIVHLLVKGLRHRQVIVFDGIKAPYVATTTATLF